MNGRSYKAGRRLGNTRRRWRADDKSENIKRHKIPITKHSQILYDNENNHLELEA